MFPHHSTHLGDEDARDAVGDAEQGLLAVCLGLGQGRLEVSGIGEDGSAVLGMGVQVRLLRVGQVVGGHCEGVEMWDSMRGGQ